MSFETPPLTPRGPPPLRLTDDPGRAGTSSAEQPKKEEPQENARRGSLRGAAPAQEESTTSKGDREANLDRISRTTVDREIKIEINQLPVNHAEYDVWRFNVLLEVLKAFSTDPDMAMFFVQDVDNLPKEELNLDGLPKDLKNLELKLYTSIMKATRGKEHIEHNKNLRSKVKVGCGRLALRQLDEDFNYEVDKTANKASSTLLRETCKDISKLGTYIATVRLAMTEVNAAGTPVPPRFGMELVKKQVKGIQDKQLQAILAEFEARPKTDKSFEVLLTLLEKVAHDHAETTGDNTTLGGAAKKKAKKQGAIAKGNNDTKPSDAQGNSLCRYCRRKGHFEKECNKRKKDIADGEITADGKPTRQALKNDHKSGYAAGNYPPCKWCKKTNHPENRCYFRKDGTQNENEKPNPGLPNGSVVHPTSIVPSTSASSGSATPITIESALAALIAKKLGGGAFKIALPAKKKKKKKKSAGTRVWYLDSGASNHIANKREILKLLHGAENALLLLRRMDGNRLVTKRKWLSGRSRNTAGPSLRLMARPRTSAVWDG